MAIPTAGQAAAGCIPTIQPRPTMFMMGRWSTHPLHRDVMRLSLCGCLTNWWFSPLGFGGRWGLRSGRQEIPGFANYGDAPWMSSPCLEASSWHRLCSPPQVPRESLSGSSDQAATARCLSLLEETAYVARGVPKIADEVGVGGHLECGPPEPWLALLR